MCPTLGCHARLQETHLVEPPATPATAEERDALRRQWRAGLRDSIYRLVFLALVLVAAIEGTATLLFAEVTPVLLGGAVPVVALLVLFVRREVARLRRRLREGDELDRVLDGPARLLRPSVHMTAGESFRIELRDARSPNFRIDSDSSTTPVNDPVRVAFRVPRAWALKHFALAPGSLVRVYESGAGPLVLRLPDGRFFARPSIDVLRR